MSTTASESKPWWQFAPLATIPARTDLGHECSHARDRHDAQGECLVYERSVPIGGYEGADADNPQGVTLEPSAEYQRYKREGCHCPGESIWHVATLPPGFDWDSLENTNWRDPNAKKTPGGEYIWWVEKP